MHFNCNILTIKLILIKYFFPNEAVAPRAIPFRALCVSAPVQSAQAKSFDGRDWTDPAVLEDHAEKIFNDPNTDGWAIRQCFNEMQVNTTSAN